METKHTPGPWNWLEQREANQYRLLTNEKRWIITYLELTSDEQKANAHLIACAPELLDALEKLLPKLSQLQDESAFTWPEKIEKLIAKAKGQ
jgi:hypothetical protein